MLYSNDEHLVKFGGCDWRTPSATWHNHSYKNPSLWHEMKQCERGLLKLIKVRKWLSFKPEFIPFQSIMNEYFRMNFSNMSNFSFDPSEIEDMYLNIDTDFLNKGRRASIILMCIYLPVFLLAVIGNVFVMLVILLNSRMRSSAANYFLVNLAIADILGKC